MHRPIMLLSLIFAFATPAWALTRDEMLLQAQAADVLGGALTDAVTRASAELDATRHLPRRSATTAPAASRKQVTYRELFDRTVVRIKKQGDAAIDPSLRSLPSGQLFQEMTALQTYNLTQYMRLIRLMDSLASSRVPTTLPAIEKLGENFTPNLQWRKQRQEVRNAVAARNSTALYDPYDNPRPTPAPTPAASIVAQDPRWQPFFYGPADSLTGWNDDFITDPYAFRGGGGVYQRFDTRVNRDYDPRTHGQFDRRVNIDADRRLNVHVDPRQNF